MWIRSQGKKILGDFKAVMMKDKAVCGYLDDTKGTVLGEYKTEERAAEVVDEIELRLIQGTKFDEIYSGKRTTSDGVFHMPQE